MTGRSVSVGATLVLAVVGSAACLAPGNNVPASAVSAAPRVDVATLDPCSLLDSATVAAELGQEVPAGAPADDDARGIATCRYPLLSNLAAMIVVVDRTPASGVGGEGILESLGPRPGLEELHGVGDVAWFGYCPTCPLEATTTLTVIAAPLKFSIAFEGAAPPATEQIHAEALARQVVGQLGL